MADRAVPATYAITNARIVPVSGPTLERGTIVIRNGLIVSVGASASAPADVPYVYFVSRNDGSHVFSETLDEHNRNVFEYQKKPARAQPSR